MKESSNWEVTDKPKSDGHFTYSGPVANTAGTMLSIGNVQATKRGMTREMRERDKGSTCVVRVIRKPDRTRDGWMQWRATIHARSTPVRNWWNVPFRTRRHTWSWSAVHASGCSSWGVTESPRRVRGSCQLASRAVWRTKRWSESNTSAVGVRSGLGCPQILLLQREKHISNVDASFDLLLFGTNNVGRNGWIRWIFEFQKTFVCYVQPPNLHAVVIDQYTPKSCCCLWCPDQVPQQRLYQWARTTLCFPQRNRSTQEGGLRAKQELSHVQWMSASLRSQTDTPQTRPPRWWHAQCLSRYRSLGMHGPKLCRLLCCGLSCQWHRGLPLLVQHAWNSLRTHDVERIAESALQNTSLRWHDLSHSCVLIWFELLHFVLELVHVDGTAWAPRVSDPMAVLVTRMANAASFPLVQLCLQLRTSALLRLGPGTLSLSTTWAALSSWCRWSRALLGTRWRSGVGRVSPLPPEETQARRFESEAPFSGCLNDGTGFRQFRKF